jgi:hypothetical protein
MNARMYCVSNNITYLRGWRNRKHKFTLGHYYNIQWTSSSAPVTLCKFIKVTRKGFNLLNVATNKCICKSHLYAPKYSGKDIPKREIAFKVNVSEYMIVKEVQQNEKEDIA